METEPRSFKLRNKHNYFRVEEFDEYTALRQELSCSVSKRD
jgi:hypothetical protein